MITRKAELYRLIPGGRSEAIIAAYAAAERAYHNEVATECLAGLGARPVEMVLGHNGQVTELLFSFRDVDQERLTVKGGLRARDPFWAKIRAIPAPGGASAIIEKITGRKQTGPIHLRIVHVEDGAYPWIAYVAADGAVMDAEMAVMHQVWITPDPEHSTPYSTVRKS